MFLPLPLLASLAHIKGFDRIAFEQLHDNGEQVTSVRVNPSKLMDYDSWTMSPVPWCPQGHYLSYRPSFTLDPSFHAGAYYVQEASSMFLWHALKTCIGTDTKKKVLDLCAAPGGKSTLLASFFGDGLVIANEVIKSRSAILVENITKWGTDQVIVTNNDPSHFQSLPGYFDLMVVDAPCSGSGLFRKDPDAVQKWSLDNVQHCSQRQQRILADVLPALQENGLLIYSTCSYSIEEDEMIADWLVKEMGMQSRQIDIHPDWGIVETRSPLQEAYGYRFYPYRLKGEGFFLAVFQKIAAAEQNRIKEQILTQISNPESLLIQTFMPQLESHYLFKQSDSIRAFPEQWLTDLQKIANCLYIKKAGIEIGTIKGKDVIPSHELALSTLSKDSFQSIQLTELQALQYLKRKEIEIRNAAKGWNLVKYHGLPLGWVKVLPNRINNYYPAGWRILKE